MIAYIGQTRARDLIDELNRLGFGEMTNRGEAPPRRSPFALDNGAFKDWTAKAPFNGLAFMRDLHEVQERGLSPDFVALPDVVAGGLDSLRFSLDWLPRVRRVLPAPLYLVVQDGQTEADIEPHLGALAGLFVGGSLPWKIQTGAAWVHFAHARGLRCHIGRVGTPRRVAWARRIGADSIDSCLPLWSRDNLRSFVEAFFGTSRQRAFDMGGAF